MHGWKCIDKSSTLYKEIIKKEIEKRVCSFILGLEVQVSRDQKNQKKDIEGPRRK